MVFTSKHNPMLAGAKLPGNKKLMPKAVILAADREEGIVESRKRYPKPLTPILGVPLLERIVSTLQRGGITQTIIVTGYRRHSIRKHLGDGSRLGIGIKYAHNREYAQGSAIGLKVARKYLSETEPFLLLTADNLVNVKTIKKVLSNLNRTPLLSVDFKPHYSRQVEDATKVFVDKEGSIVNIGKNIRKRNGIFTGVLLLDNTIFKIIEQLEKKAQPLTVTECLKQVTADGSPLWACDVSNNFWFHVDTPEDVSFVEHLLSGVPQKPSKNPTDN